MPTNTKQGWFLLFTSRKTNLDFLFTLTYLKSFLPSFLQKSAADSQRTPVPTERSQKCVSQRPLTQKLFAFFFQKSRLVSPPHKQKNQPCFTINLNSKVFCPLFHKKVRSLLYIRSKSRTTNSDTTITIAQKFFFYFFFKKVGYSAFFSSAFFSA